MAAVLRTWKAAGLMTCLGLIAACAYLSGCGSDGGSTGGPFAVRITIAGAPNEPMVPGQSAQLSASATFSDGTARDVTTVATWDTTDRNVIALSVGGSITAAGPGRAEVVATLGSARDSISVTVIVLPAAYFLDGKEYAFEYQLDATYRVASYRISKKPDIDYGSGFGETYVVEECQGDLNGSYVCSYYGLNAMRGESGRLAYVSRGLGEVGSATYSYSPWGLSAINATWRGPSTHFGGSTTTTLTYDTKGRLASVDRDDSCYGDAGTRGTRSVARIAMDARGRLAHADYAADEYGYPWACPFRETNYVPSGVVGPTDWTYDSQGYMIVAGATTYSVDADGWLSQRSVGGGASAVTDTYAIVRQGTRVVEESFTQAEPRAYYVHRGPQRVRYEWARLPSEPLFVPRALTGLNGADYFGVISSHHR